MYANYNYIMHVGYGYIAIAIAIHETRIRIETCAGGNIYHVAIGKHASLVIIYVWGNTHS